MSKMIDLLLRTDANVICRSTRFSELQAIKLTTQGKNRPLMTVDPDGIVKVDTRVFKELYGIPAEKKEEKE